ncbi:hypothetical protein P4S63_02150 [Pseudoalteromonas sp. B193]
MPLKSQWHYRNKRHKDFILTVISRAPYPLSPPAKLLRFHEKAGGGRKTLEAQLYSPISEVDGQSMVLFSSTIFMPEQYRLNRENVFRDFHAMMILFLELRTVGAEPSTSTNRNRAGKAADFGVSIITPRTGNSCRLYLGQYGSIRMLRLRLVKRNDAKSCLMDGFKQTLDWDVYNGHCNCRPYGHLAYLSLLQRLRAKEIKAIESGDMLKGLYPVELHSRLATLVGQFFKTL